mgnify:CR=1 FL=1
MGAYNITASSATGGTFTAGNYNISYADGSLTVVAREFAGRPLNMLSANLLELTAGQFDRDDVAHVEREISQLAGGGRTPGQQRPALL